MCEGSLLFFIMYIIGATFGRQHLDIAPEEARTAAALMAVVASVGMSSVGLYNRDYCVDLGQVASRALVGLLLIMAGVAGAVEIYGLVVAGGARPGYLVQAVAGLATFFPLLLGLRRSFLHLLDRFDLLRRRVLVLGEGRHAHQVSRLAAATGDRVFTVVATLAEPVPDGLADLCRRERIDEVVVTDAKAADLPLRQLLACKLDGTEVTPYLTFWEREMGQVDLDAVTPGWLVFCDGFRRGRMRAFVKRTVDVVLAALLLAVSLPLTLPVALLIRLESPGPIFYRQERVGRHGRGFNILKFRSMRQDAEKDGPQWAARNDARVTRVGAFIRKVRIDEIPQAINVLKGEMSFVGPRPERPVFVDALRQIICHYDERHAVKPGITGWAQINYPYGATAEDAKNKLAYDLYYVKNASLFLDLIIFLQTVKVLLWHEGAR
jgi:sugar transferase (PEP-CTERM system associated)